MSQMAHDIRLHFAEMYKADVLLTGPIKSA